MCASCHMGSFPLIEIIADIWNSNKIMGAKHALLVIRHTFTSLSHSLHSLRSLRFAFFFSIYISPQLTSPALDECGGVSVYTCMSLSMFSSYTHFSPMSNYVEYSIWNTCWQSCGVYPLHLSLSLSLILWILFHRHTNNMQCATHKCSYILHHWMMMATPNSVSH